MAKDLSYKAQQREALRRKIDDYLSHGGRIKEVAPGVSGAHHGGDWRRHPSGEQKPPPQERIPLNHVIAAIEARKQARRSSSRVTLRRKPRRKLIYDDFGEPLRWQWVDE
ncbi:hypothetical protein K8B33_04850 [Alcanivorax sp. JB21]|uniref:hypothetical protein n=1 Tax=Alcanivorax limicola TaxID=2874102 RepID=UPI001CBD7535|nr:hypothetical protein [Alcanivorax limicola]MBZ2188411.1 hypothetical protein [Alcanivorax limicola]